MQDWNDSNILSKRANFIVRIANKYRKTRKDWSDAQLYLNSKLAVKYKNKEISKSISIEKAYINLIEDALYESDYEDVKYYYDRYIKLEAEYKGLERVLEAHQGRLSLCQSLIRNQQLNT